MIIGICLVGCARAELMTEVVRLAQEQDAVAWGKAVNALQCRLLPQMQTVEVAEGAKPDDVKVFVTYELRNVGKKPVRFSPFYTPLEDVNGALEVIGPDGTPAPPLLPCSARMAPKPE
ncbi:unnamed protein product, partial [marine sediment metagenome]